MAASGPRPGRAEHDQNEAAGGSLATCPRCAMHCSLTPSLRSSDFHVTELWQQGMSMTYDRFQPKRVQMRRSNKNEV